MNCLESAISVIGGKSYLSKWLCSFLPEHVCYVEPFAGGAKLLFAKELSPVEILNDVDDNIVNLYRVIQNSEKRQKLINILDETPYARSVFQSLKHSKPENEIEKAARYFYLCRASFAGDTKRGGFAVPSVTGRNPVQSFRNAVDSLDTIAERLRGVCVENLPYAEVIRRYDSEDTLFYCDPPYLNTEHYYGDRFTKDDHCKLNNFLHNVQAKVMLSHYECDTYNQLYQDWNKYTYESFKGAYKAEPGTEKPVTVECLYCNFQPVKTKGLFTMDVLNASGCNKSKEDL
jgi:DNA adenine methylase